MATKRNVRFSFPLYSRVENKEYAYDYYLCLVDSMEQKDAFCNHHFGNFDSLIHHLKFEHMLPLSSYADFCRDCKEIFHTVYDALSHHLSHLLSLKQLELFYSQATSQDKKFLERFYEKWKNDKIEIMDRSLFAQFQDDCEDICSSDSSTQTETVQEENETVQEEKKEPEEDDEEEVGEEEYCW